MIINERFHVSANSAHMEVGFFHERQLKDANYRGGYPIDVY